MKNFHISKDISELSVSFAEWIISYADDVLKKKDTFTIALSGGNTPKNFTKF
jgi:6-phosphogluconolactonase